MTCCRTSWWDPPTKVLYDPEPENSLLEIYYLYTLPESDLVVIVGARNIEDLDEDKAIDCIIGSSITSLLLPC